jgi:uncharacterized protein
MPMIYPLSAVRALALHTQGLVLADGHQPVSSPEAIYAQIEKLGCVQIDTLQVVQRSHYLVLWSRLGLYSPHDLDRLIYDPLQRRLFEGWQHAASIIPLVDYRYQMPHQRKLRESPAEMSVGWLSEPGSQELLESVLTRILREGALRVADFEYEGPKRGPWWDWKPAKNALEHHLAWGNLMISNRQNIQRVYDLTGRVLPEWVDTHEPSVEVRDRFWLEQAFRVLGACKPGMAADYAFMKRGRAAPVIKDLLVEGVVIEIQADLRNGSADSLFVHRENLPALDQAAEGDIKPEKTTFLSPFDNLFWARGRDQLFWSFHNVLEAYKPAPARTWGYFCLPILHRDRLIGRFDPRLDRKNKRLYLKSLFLEPGVELEEVLLSSVAAAMRNFLAFHAASDVVIENSFPHEFGDMLEKSM